MILHNVLTLSEEFN